MIMKLIGGLPQESLATEDDFVSVNESLFFPPCSPLSCVSITTRNDELIEGTEVFQLILQTPPGLDSRVRLSQQNTTTVYINDDDCKLALELNINSLTSFLTSDARVNMQFPGYLVTEEDGVLNVCAVVLYSSDQTNLNNINVRLVLTPGTAG